VKIWDSGSFLYITIETRKYRRYTSISKNKPFIKTIDQKYVFESKEAYFKFRNEWIEAKKLKELIDTGKMKEHIRNSPKQKKYQNLMIKKLNL